MTKSCNILKYLVLTCLMVIAFPALSYSQIHTTRLEPAASSFSLEKAYQVAGIYWLPDYLKDNTSRDYNTNAGNPATMIMAAGMLKRPARPMGMLLRVQLT